jgi:hypothetical protein
MAKLSVPVIRIWEDGEILARETESNSKRGFSADPEGAYSIVQPCVHS